MSNTPENDPETGTFPTDCAADAPAQSQGLGRRDVLKGSFALGASASLTVVSSKAMAQSDRSAAPVTKVDVVVVGAGLSGLSAARRLKKAGKSVAVLEGRDRVGGRAYSEPVKSGGWVDMGAQWIGPDQDRVLALADEF